MIIKEKMKITNALKIALKSMLSLKFGSVKTDKAELFWDGDEDLKVGDEVYVLGGDPEDNAEYQPAPDGDYTVEDGKVIKVVEGKVAEIVDPKAEVAEEPVEEPVEEVAQEEVKQEKNEEVEPVEEPEQTEEISVEERVAALEARLAEFTEGLNTIINSIAALEERIAGVEGKLSKVEEPAADPVDEAPDVEQNSHKSVMSYLRKD